MDKPFGLTYTSPRNACQDQIGALRTGAAQRSGTIRYEAAYSSGRMREMISTSLKGVCAWVLATVHQPSRK